MIRALLSSSLIALSCMMSGCQAQQEAPSPTAPADSLKASAWCGVLSPDAYRILREQGTEPRFSGEFWLHDEDGMYVCMGCGAQLFDSGAKFKSNSGWPSFSNPRRHGGRRPHGPQPRHAPRVVCAACNGHLGHVFEDGPRPRAFATASTAWRWISCPGQRGHFAEKGPGVSFHRCATKKASRSDAFFVGSTVAQRLGFLHTKVRPVFLISSWPSMTLPSASRTGRVRP